MLGTKEGRAFLADPGVNPEARMWAANQVAADPAGTAKMIAGQDKPWESDAVVQAFARPAVERMAATRGNETTRLDGGSDIDNFVGASIGTGLLGERARPCLPVARSIALAAAGALRHIPIRVPHAGRKKMDQRRQMRQVP